MLPTPPHSPRDPSLAVSQDHRKTGTSAYAHAMQNETPCLFFCHASCSATLSERGSLTALTALTIPGVEPGLIDAMGFSRTAVVLVVDRALYEARLAVLLRTVVVDGTRIIAFVDRLPDDVPFLSEAARNAATETARADACVAEPLLSQIARQAERARSAGRSDANGFEGRNRSRDDAGPADQDSHYRRVARRSVSRIFHR